MGLASEKLGARHLGCPGKIQGTPIHGFLPLGRRSRRCKTSSFRELKGLLQSVWGLLTLGHMDIGLVQTRAEAGDARYVRHSLTAKGAELSRKMITKR
jgi:hypothetical protein